MADDDDECHDGGNEQEDPVQGFNLKPTHTGEFIAYMHVEDQDALTEQHVEQELSEWAEGGAVIIMFIVQLWAKTCVAEFIVASRTVSLRACF